MVGAVLKSVNLLQKLRTQLREFKWKKIKGLAAKSLKVSILLVVIFEVIPTLGEFWYTTKETKKEATKYAHQEAVNLLNLAAYDYERAIEKVEQLLMVLAEVPELNDPRSPKCSVFLDKIRRQYPIYANFGVIMPDGISVCSGLPQKPNVNLGDRIYFTKVIKSQGFSMGEFQIGRITGKPTVNFGYPLFNAKKEIRAVLYAAMDLNMLKQLTMKVGLPVQASFFILDENGKFLVHHPESENLLGHEIQDRDVLNKIKFGGEQVFELDKMYASTNLRSAKEAGSIYLAVGVPKEVFLARFDKILKNRLFQDGISALIQILFAWAAGFIFLWQIKKLERAAAKINQGDLSARTNMKAGFGEIERLSASFDQMASLLEGENKRLRFLTESAKELCQLESLDERLKRVADIAIAFFCDECIILIQQENQVKASQRNGLLVDSIEIPVIVFKKEFGEIIFRNYQNLFQPHDLSVAEDIAAYIGLVAENTRLKKPVPDLVL